MMPYRQAENAQLSVFGKKMILVLGDLGCVFRMMKDL
jgi:hypothetical protein